MEIKKAIIPVAGLGTRFLPLSKAVPKEFFPLVDKPVIQYVVEEAKKSGISEIIFVVSPKQKMILNYFKESPELKKILIKRKKEDILEELKFFEEVFQGISFSFVVQKKPAGDGHAILQALKIIDNEPVAVSFGDDIIDFETPAIFQLINIFKTCLAPVVGLKSLPKEKLSAYGVVAVEKISSRLYKIKKITEKPDISELPSNLAIVGKYILTPEVFDYLKKAAPAYKGEMILADTLDKMLADGKTIYGYELKGEWLECGNKLKWLKSFLYLVLKDPRFEKELKEYLKTIKL
ncbi:MAG: UTP--glucose-1-phosphate uridylyltransferase [Parcubacteria group bacterium Licking1014_1]|nr:MAG: UTP--glucose-1-phosphate uridylyltransferase [Parcubacteria group bacterium Licking1014_1]